MPFLPPYYRHKPSLRLALTLALIGMSTPAHARLDYPLPGKAVSDEPTEIAPRVVDRRVPHMAPFPTEELEKPPLPVVVVDNAASEPGSGEVSIAIPAIARGTSARPTTLNEIIKPTGPIDVATAEPLVLAMALNGSNIDQYISGIIIGKWPYISLGDLVQVLDFPIKVSPADKKARGWFIRESNVFELDDHDAAVAGRDYKLDDTDILYLDGDIYVAQPVLARWFGLNFMVNTRQMALQVKSDQPLPFEERLRRQRLLQQRNGTQGRTPGDFMRAGQEYKLFAFPYIDFNIEQNFGSPGNSENTTEYSLISEGDVLGLSMNTLLSGDLANERLTQARLRFSRRDENSELLGPLKASQFSFGDVNGTALSLVASSSQGRGFTLTNRSLYRAEQFDVTSFRGNATPGWDVELYRNDILVEIKMVADDGQYEFLNIPVYYGRNAFKIVLYGPQGQIQEEAREIYAGDTMLEPGSFTYNLSATDNNKSLFGLSDTNSATSGMRMVGEVEYGITKWLTAAAGMSQQQQEDGEHQYVTTSLRTNLLDTLTSIDMAHDPSNSTTAGRISIGTNIWGIDTRLRQTWYGGLISDENSDVDNLLKQTTSLDLNSDLRVFGNLPISFGLTVAQKQYENGEERTVISTRTSTSAMGISLSNTVEHVLGHIGDTRGTLALRGSIGRVLLGAELDYGIKPEAEVTGLNLTSQFYPMNNVVNRSVLTINTDKSYDISNTVSIDMKKYGISFIAGGNSEKNFYVGLGLNFSLTQLPDGEGWHFQNRTMTDSGGAMMRAYLDKNANSVRDEDEPYLRDVSFMRNNSPIPQSEDGQHTFTSQFSSNTPVRIGIEPSSLEDPQYMPAVPGFEVLPRAGHTARLDFPIIETAQLEGTIYLTQEGAQIPAPRVQVELQDTSGKSVRATLSEFDGYYTFPAVRPGQYMIKAFTETEDSALSRSITRQIELKGLDYITADLQLQ